MKNTWALSEHDCLFLNDHGFFLIGRWLYIYYLQNDPDTAVSTGCRYSAEGQIWYRWGTYWTRKGTV